MIIFYACISAYALYYSGGGLMVPPAAVGQAVHTRGQGLGRGGEGRGDWRGEDWGGVGLGIGAAL